MKKGDICQIYQKPLTREAPEGLAKLIRPSGVNLDSPEGELWEVRFVGEEGEYMRLIPHGQEAIAVAEAQAIVKAGA